MNKYSLIAAALWLVLSAGAAVAEHGIVAELTVVKVAPQARHTTESGDMVEYRITYRNTAHDYVRNVVGTLTIPADRLSYVPDSAAPGIVEVSIDGKAFAPAPLLRLVTTADGHTKMEPVPASQYRFLRWRVGELPPKGSTTVTARMRVEELPVVVVSNTSRP